MRSLLSQLFYSHLAVAAGTVLLTGLLTSFLFGHYYTSQQETLLTDQAGQLAQTAAGLMQRPDSSAQLSLLSETAGRMMSGKVCVLDLRDANSLPPQPEMVSSEAPEIEHTTLECMNGPVVVIRMPVLESGTKARIGLVVVRCPVSGMETIPQTERAILVGATCAGIGLALLVAMVLAPRLTRPLVDAAEAARRVAGGDFKVRLEHTGPAEAQSLAASVNTMAAELADAFQRLEGERDRLAALERMRRDFIANASHELRAPLTSIQGFIGALQDGTARTDEQRQRCIDVTLQQAAVMRRLVDQLMELSRLQAGTLNMEHEPLDLAEVVAGAVAGMSPQAEAAGVKLVVATETAAITGDGAMLWRVVGNLLDNAIRVAPPGSQIEVSLTALGGKARVRVRDHGPGIPEDDLPLIWERFHKADKAHSRDDSGAGLGLAIAKEIVARHGGTIGAENAPDGGAVVSFEVPVG